MDNERYLQTKEELKQKLDELYLELADKINEYGNQIRNVADTNRTDMTSHLNKLKIDQFKIKEYMVKIDGTEEPDWENFRTEAEKSSVEIEDNLKNNIPASV